MNRREEQAFNDGRNAFRAGKTFVGSSRRSISQRAAWQRGFEHERRLDTAAKVTDGQREEAERTVARLKDWAREQKAKR